MQFTELLEKRRSIRKYEDRPVDINLLKDLISKSTLAPSAGNDQTWKFIIIANKELLKRISDECKKNLLKLIENHPEHYVSKYTAMLSEPAFDIFYNAPSLVLILGNRNDKNLEYDCTLAASYLMLSATDKGLGTCWINFAKSVSDPRLLEEMGIMKEHTIVAPIIVGYPGVVPAIPKRNDPEIIKIVCEE